MKRYPARRQSGFVLLAVMVFMLVAALLALGDMRTLTVQQTLVTSLYAAENAMAETESALSTMEQYAAYEGAELEASNGLARLTTLTPAATCETNKSSCIKERCNSFLYPKYQTTGDDNVAGNAGGKYRQKRTGSLTTECSFCPPPTLGLGCQDRWDETPGIENSPWAEFHVNFYRTTNDNQPYSPQTSVSLKKNFYGMVEYLGWAPCNLTDLAPNGTNLDVYDTASESDKSRGCRLMRVTVRNQPPVVSAPVITLQSTLVVTSALYLPAYVVPSIYNTTTYTDPMPNCCYLAASAPPASAIAKPAANPNTVRGIIDAERISWRQIFPN